MIHKAVLCWNTIFGVFNKTQLCGHERVQLEKNKHLPKIGGRLPKCWKVFFVVCFFLVVLFFVACVFVLLFCKKAPKGYFPAICSPKRPALKCVFSSFSVFFPCFAFVFQNYNLFLCFLSINSFWEKTLCGDFFCLSYLSFTFLMLASFFETNFLASPFWNPSCFCFWHVFLLLFLFLFSWCMFLPFCFDVSFVFVTFYFVFTLFLFCFSFAFRQWKKHCFPCNASVFCHVGFEVVDFFPVSCFCYCFFLCCFPV